MVRVFLDQIGNVRKVSRQNTGIRLGVEILDVRCSILDEGLKNLNMPNGINRGSSIEHRVSSIEDRISSIYQVIHSTVEVLNYLI